jgi:hypothetical protein
MDLPMYSAALGLPIPTRVSVLHENAKHLSNTEVGDIEKVMGLA